MASISIGGTVTCKEGNAPVSLKTFDDGGKSASFSVLDKEYVYTKQGEDRFGQFYNVQVNGKGAEIALERLQRGDRVTVHGQLVQREYQGKIYLDVKNARVTFQEARRDEGGFGGKPSDEEVPF